MICFGIIIFIFFNIISTEINLCSLRGYQAGCEMIGEGIYNALSKNFNVNFIHNRDNSIINSNKSKITIFADMLWYEGMDLYKTCPNTFIKIAYTMFEGSILPKKWVYILNNYFDAAIVPDNYLIELYQNNGVKIPIFLIPMAMPDLHKINNNNHNNNNIFTFGIISGIAERKGLKDAIKAFALKFGNNSNYKLMVHSYWASDGDTLSKINDLITKLNCKNIKFSYGVLEREAAINLYNEIDCLVACSAGEGFSLTPREALKCQIPVICLDYGAQKSICDTGYVYRLLPNKKIPCIIQSYGGYCGEIQIADTKNIYLAMQSVIEKYDLYKLLAQNSQKWLKKFSCETAANSFKNLLSPQKIYLSDKNLILDNGFTTKCDKFAKKFTHIISKI